MKATVLSVLALALLVLATPATAARFLVDFGRNDVATGGNQGAITASPDVNGNYWNNFNKEAFNANTGSLDVPDNAAITGLVDTANNSSGLGVQLINGAGNWEANGAANGGLLTPNVALLGDLAIPTATRDYFFTTQASASFFLNGLDPLSIYDLTFFAVRTTGDVRNTQYRATDANGASLSAILQTSGAGSGSAGNPTGNDDTTVSILGLVPDANNSIRVDMLTNSGGFSYIGILDINATTTIPEPATGLLLGAAGLGLVVASRRLRRAV
jgi:hypothetical protein